MRVENNAGVDFEYIQCVVVLPSSEDNQTRLHHDESERTLAVHNSCPSPDKETGRTLGRKNHPMREDSMNTRGVRRHDLIYRVVSGQTNS